MTYMNFVSVLGLLTLIFIAWLLSFHRTRIKMRPILWGMGLQFLFALIILSKDPRFSFLGMAIFGLILVAYILKGQPFSQDKPIVKHAVHGLAALLLGTALYFLHPFASLSWILFILVVALFINGVWLKKERIQFWGSAALVTALVAFFIASNQTGKMLFESFSDSVKYFLNLSDYGADFLFGNLSKEEYFFTNDPTFPGFGMVFAFKVLPTIIFFGGFMSVLYYLGVMQKIIGAMSRFMRWSLGTSGSESLSCSANIFVGQTEAPLLVKPFLSEMTSSELLTIMVGGFATIAGGVLAAYINMGVDPGHLIAASVMSAPAALVMAKIIYPELEKSATSGEVAMPKIETGDNILEAAATGISDGFKLALNVGAMLIGFIALIAVLDVLLNWIDSWIDGRWLGGQMRDYAIQSTMSPVSSEYAGIFPDRCKPYLARYSVRWPG